MFDHKGRMTEVGNKNPEESTRFPYPDTLERIGRSCRNPRVPLNIILMLVSRIQKSLYLLYNESNKKKKSSSVDTIYDRISKTGTIGDTKANTRKSPTFFFLFIY